jgi:hypothetical protein
VPPACKAAQLVRLKLTYSQDFGEQVHLISLTELGVCVKNTGRSVKHLRLCLPHSRAGSRGVLIQKQVNERILPE